MVAIYVTVTEKKHNHVSHMSHACIGTAYDQVQALKGDWRYIGMRSAETDDYLVEIRSTGGYIKIADVLPQFRNYEWNQMLEARKKAG